MMVKRQSVAVALRKQGASYAVIAAHIAKMDEFSSDYNRMQAWRDVTGVLDQAIKENVESAEQLREIELQRLDELQSKYWANAVKGDFISLDKVLSIMDRRWALTGLLKPQAVQQVNINTLGLTVEGGSAPRRTTAELMDELRRLNTSMITLQHAEEQPDGLIIPETAHPHG